MSDGGHVETALRAAAPQALGVLVRRHRDFDRCEDALQEALLAAARDWDRAPEHPVGWLVTVAERRLIDDVRRDAARAAREERAARHEPRDAPAAEEEDDSLALLFLCCHPELAAPAQLSLTLRAVAGLTTAEIARALLLPEATIAQRISRAKARIRESGLSFGVPPELERGPRLAVVCRVLYLLFTEGHVASAGEELQRPDLAAEAIRLTRMLHARLPGEAEVAGLLALMLLSHARRAARTDAVGGLVPLAEQDRGLWDRAGIEEGVALVLDALPRPGAGPYALQAAIAAVHAEAPTAQETDWAEVLGLYDVLLALDPGPVVAINRAVAVGEVDGPRAGLAALDEIADDPRVAGHHRTRAVRAHLLARAGERAAAAAAYAEASRRSPSEPEKRFLAARAAQLREG